VGINYARKLGNVLFWLGIIIAVGWLAMVASNVLFSGPPERWEGAHTAVTIIPPIVALGVGWVLRYILAGQTR